MSDDPVRWKYAEDAPPHVRDLLRDVGADPPMPPDVRAALLAQLPSSTPGQALHPSPPQATHAAHSASLLTSPIPWGLGAVGILAITALLWGAQKPQRPPAQEAPIAAPPVQSAPIAPPIATANEVPVTPSASAAPSASIGAHARPLARAAPSATDTLAEENALVGRARAMLAAAPAVALSAIDEHARRFPRGELASEREYLRIRALHRLERADEAIARGRVYLTTFPSSPYASAVRNILAELGAP